MEVEMVGGTALCVTGMPGSGKEAFLEIAGQRGLPVIRMGDVVREEAARRGIGLTDEGVGGMADREREKHGMDVWARRTLERIETDRVIIDGLRSLEELDAFASRFTDGVVLVAVHASPSTRYRRIAQRARQDDIASEAAFRTRDRRELRWGLGGVIALADEMVVNEGDREEFQAEVRAILERVFP
ncbi:MAG: AAA family ATPase [Thermoplasmata archaeon]